MGEMLFYVSMIILAVLLFTNSLVLFPISVYKCTGGWNNRNRLISVLLLLILNPVIILLASSVVTTPLRNLVLYVMIGQPESELIKAFTHAIINSFFLCLFSFGASRVIAKYFRQDDSFLLYFLFMMYMVMLLTTDNNADNSDFSANIGLQIISLAWNLVPLAVMVFSYTQVVIPLSKICGKGIRANKKIFVVPITIIVMIFNAITCFYSMSKSVVNIIIEYVYTLVIVLLLMWAFSVIIKNIAATNEAIDAKDEAIEAKNGIKELSVEVMEALAHTIDAKDEYTRGHSVRVAGYSRMIAEKMGLSSEECENAYYMGLLHDLGKIGVPNEIINSPAKLTDEEYAVIKTHPGLGFDILSEIKTRPDLVIGARWHHERYDGKGYPDGKNGEDIPLMARIIAVADSYDAMTSNRSYRKYMPQDKVKSEIEKNMGTQFDPDIAKYMIAIIDEDKDYKLHE